MIMLIFFLNLKKAMFLDPTRMENNLKSQDLLTGKMVDQLEQVTFYFLMRVPLVQALKLPEVKRKLKKWQINITVRLEETLMTFLN